MVMPAEKCDRCKRANEPTQPVTVLYVKSGTELQWCRLCVSMFHDFCDNKDVPAT